MKQYLLLGAGAAFGSIMSGALQAQEITLEEVVVTAQKREESAQKIPIAIDVITADTFIREGVRDVKDLNKLSTDLKINFAGGQATVIGIRGMQQAGFSPNADPLAAVHLDGAYIASFWGLNGLMYDLERIEVLSGPQGTLYGRNTAAGAVNLISKKPGHNFEGDVSMDLGSYNSRRFTGGVTLPVSDTLSFRLGGMAYTRDAIFTDGGGEQEQWAGRLSTVWNITDKDTLYATFDFSHFGGTSESTGATLLGLADDARAYDVPSGQYTANPPASVTNYRPLLNNDPYNNLPYLRQRGLVFTGRTDQYNWGIMGQYTHNFDGFDSVFQYSHRKLSGINNSPTKSAAAFSQNIFTNVITNDVAELRLVSKNDSNLEWVGGLFYYQNEAKGINATPTALGNFPDPVTGLHAYSCPCSFGFAPNSGEGYSYAAFGQATWTPENLNRLHATLGLRYTFDHKEATLGYWINNRLYTLMTPDGVVPAYWAPYVVTPLQATANQPATTLFNNGKDDWDQVQYRVGLEYDLTDTSQIYGTISTGYKSGGFQYGTTPKIEPENLTAFEVGSKNTFLDNRLRFNTAAWYYIYEDIEIGIQRNIPPPFPVLNGVAQTAVFTVGSAGRVDLAGISVDTEWLLTQADRLGFSGTWSYSKVKDGYETVNGVKNQILNEGVRYSESPEWVLLGRYGHTFTFTGGATLNPEIKYQWQSERYDASGIPPGAVAPGVTTINPTGAGGQPATFNLTRHFSKNSAVPSQGILDVSLRYAPAGNRWDLTGYVNNVTDELNIRGILPPSSNPGYQENPLAPTYGHITGALGDPRTYGVILSARF